MTTKHIEFDNSDAPRGTLNRVPLPLAGTGWNDVAKQCSARSAQAKRTSPRKRSTGAGREPGKDGILQGNGDLSREEDAARHTETARDLVLEAWPKIVQGLIKKATGGGYQQTKLLLDLCGITGSEVAALDEQRRQQLCDALLEGLGLSTAQMDAPTSAQVEATGTDTGSVADPEKAGEL